jgi:hypothetical protein
MNHREMKDSFGERGNGMRITKWEEIEGEKMIKK